MTSNLLFARLTRLFHHSLLARNLALLLLWLAVWLPGMLVEFTEHASVWFPVSGLTFAALFIVGLRAVPALFVACVLMTIWTGYHYQLNMTLASLSEAGVLFAMAHILPYFAGAFALRYLAKLGRYSLPHFVVAFLLVAVFSALITTLAVVWSLVISGMLSADEVSSTWLPFWIGDLAGIIVVAPLMAGVMTILYPGPRFQLTRLLGRVQWGVSKTYKYKLLLNALFLTALMLFAHYSHDPHSAFAVYFLVIPHMWLACTESAFYNVISIVLSSLLIVLGVNLLQLMDYVMVYQFALCVIAANALFGIAVPTLTAANMQLQRIATTDSLTQVFSREHLQQQASRQLLRCQQQATPLCLMVFDIDYFKQINDVHGHAKGDLVLQRACELTKQVLRPDDFLGRFGGDEFIVVLPNTDAAAAKAVGERILLQLNQLDIGIGQRISASVGVAQSLPEDRFQTLFERADSALYQAKQQGRNRVMQG